MLRNFPRNFWAFVLWLRKNPRKIPSKFPTKFSKFPCEKSKKIHRRASAGAQGENFWEVCLGTLTQNLRRPFRSGSMRKLVLELSCIEEGQTTPKKSHPKINNSSERVFWTISVGFLTHVTEKPAEVRANFYKSSCKRDVLFFVCWYFWIWGWGFWPLPFHRKFIQSVYNFSGVNFHMQLQCRVFPNYLFIQLRFLSLGGLFSYTGRPITGTCPLFPRRLSLLLSHCVPCWAFLCAERTKSLETTFLGAERTKSLGSSLVLLESGLVCWWDRLYRWNFGGSYLFMQLHLANFQELSL